MSDFPEVVERARRYPAAVLCDVQGRRGAMPRIRALNLNMTVPAFTVEVRLDDPLAQAGLPRLRP